MTLRKIRERRREREGGREGEREGGRYGGRKGERERKRYKERRERKYNYLIQDIVVRIYLFRFNVYLDIKQYHVN